MLPYWNLLLRNCGSDFILTKFLSHCLRACAIEDFACAQSVVMRYVPQLALQIGDAALSSLPKQFPFVTLKYQLYKCFLRKISTRFTAFVAFSLWQFTVVVLLAFTAARSDTNSACNWPLHLLRATPLLDVLRHVILIFHLLYPDSLRICTFFINHLRTTWLYVQAVLRVTTVRKQQLPNRSLRVFR